MRKSILLQVLSFFLIFPAYASAACNLQKSSPDWKAGVAKVNITPRESMWMAGYGSRDHPSEGTLHDLWAKALVLEDAGGNKAVLITTDLAGFRETGSNRIRDRLNAKFGLSRAQIILNSSHTHSGPVTRTVKEIPEAYPKRSKEAVTGEFSPEQQEKIARYTAGLENQIVNLVGDAIKSIQPVKISTGSGIARFAVNRRTNIEAEVRDGAKQLAGPVDHSVPVLKITGLSGELLAVVFGYACHNTVLSIYKWSGDYAGFAQIELEKAHPGMTAMYFQGAGADQNPLPRRTIALAQQYGTTLACAVERVISDPMQELTPKLVTTYSEIDLGFIHTPAISASSISFPSTYSYPVQIWRIGEQNLVALGGEVVIDYVVRLKQMLGNDLFVMGYTNTVMGYIPSTRVLREGGYEGARVHMYFGNSDIPAVWKPDIEVLILKEVLELASKAGIVLR